MLKMNTLYLPIIRSIAQKTGGWWGVRSPSLKGWVPDTPPTPVFCVIDVIIGRYRVFILSMSRVFILACVV
jgi:hypothetical protein